jgi:hypothetical protein
VYTLLSTRRKRREEALERGREPRYRVERVERVERGRGKEGMLVSSIVGSSGGSSGRMYIFPTAKKKKTKIMTWLSLALV